MYFSLVIPAYNEAARIESSIDSLKAAVQRWGTEFSHQVEILIVVEKSQDGTAELAQARTLGAPHFSVIANPIQKGKGYAVKTGMLEARGDIVFFMDADLSTDLREVDEFLNYFRLNPAVSVLIGSRRHPGSEIVKRQNIIRQQMGRTFNWFVRRLAIPGIRDTQCGFKAFRKQSVLPIFSRQTTVGFSFDVEILMLTQMMGFKIEALPVRWKNAEGSKVRIVRDSLKMLRELLTVRLRVSKNLRALPYEPTEEKHAA